MHSRGTVDVQILQYDDVLLFYPVLPCIKAALTITEKSLVCDASTKFMSQVKYQSRCLIDEVKRNDKIIGCTDQGFLLRIITALLQNNKSYDLKNMRTADCNKGTFPKPHLDLMYGFRFSQQELLTQFLNANVSGLIGAPTRYGKTALMINTLRAFPSLVAVVTAPGVDLVKQLYADIKKAIPNREVKLICSGSYTRTPSDTGITVCSADSLDKCDPGATELLLADEPHALVTDNRLKGLRAFTKARRYGFGATLKGRFDGRDALIEGIFGPVVVERTYKEAVAEGAICPLNVIFLRVPIDSSLTFWDRNAAYNSLLFHSEEMAQITRRICEEVIPQEWQTMIFIKDEKQAEMWLEAIGEEHTIAMAKRLTKKEREEVDRRMKANEIKRCLCTKIYVQGVTFSDVRCLVNCEAGGNNTSAIQKPGRLAEIRPNKKCGIVIDFLFEPDARGNGGAAWNALCRDSLGRKAAYEEKGYGIYEVGTIEELKQIFDKLK